MSGADVAARRRSIARFGAVALILTACATPQPLAPGDTDVLVTVERLAEFGLVLPPDHRRYESFRRSRTLGVEALEYEFDAPDDVPIYVYSLAELHPTPADACGSFTAGNVALWLGELEHVDRSDLFRYGTRSRFSIIENEGAAVGNVFAMCHSRTAMLVMFAGIYFDETEHWSALIAPHLAALEAFEQANP